MQQMKNSIKDKKHINVTATNTNIGNRRFLNVTDYYDGQIYDLLLKHCTILQF